MFPLYILSVPWMTQLLQSICITEWVLKAETFTIIFDQKDWEDNLSYGAGLQNYPSASQTVPEQSQSLVKWKIAQLQPSSGQFQSSWANGGEASSTVQSTTRTDQYLAHPGLVLPGLILLQNSPLLWSMYRPQSRSPEMTVTVWHKGNSWPSVVVKDPDKTEVNGHYGERTPVVRLGSITKEDGCWRWGHTVGVPRDWVPSQPPWAASIAFLP